MEICDILRSTRSRLLKDDELSDKDRSQLFCTISVTLVGVEMLLYVY